MGALAALAAAERHGDYGHGGGCEQLAGEGAQGPVQARVGLVADDDPLRLVLARSVGEGREGIVV